jgi:hypothetical protein
MADPAVSLSFGQLLAIALAPAAVAGIVGIVGGLLGPWFLEARKQEAERKKRREEKFAELIAAIHEHDHWLDIARSVRVIGMEKELGVNPITKAMAITAVYFPQFQKEMEELDYVAGQFESWQFEAGQKRIAGNEDYRAGHIEAYNPLSKKRHAILKSLNKFGNEEFK